LLMSEMWQRHTFWQRRSLKPRDGISSATGNPSPPSLCQTSYRSAFSLHAMEIANNDCALVRSSCSHTGWTVMVCSKGVLGNFWPQVRSVSCIDCCTSPEGHVAHWFGCSFTWLSFVQLLQYMSFPGVCTVLRSCLQI